MPSVDWPVLDFVGRRPPHRRSSVAVLVYRLQRHGYRVILLLERERGLGVQSRQQFGRV